jgi:hypothetical protein
MFCDIYLYTLCYYICCLLWRMYEMHLALFLKAGCDKTGRPGPKFKQYRPFRAWVGPGRVAQMYTYSIYCLLFSCCRRFDPGGSLDRRVNCRRVSQPRWVGARRSTKGGEGETGKRGNPRPSCCPAPRSGALAVGGYKRLRGRERGTLRVGPSSRVANLLVREP